MRHNLGYSLISCILLQLFLFLGVSFFLWIRKGIFSCKRNYKVRKALKQAKKHAQKFKLKWTDREERRQELLEELAQLVEFEALKEPDSSLDEGPIPPTQPSELLVEEPNVDAADLVSSPALSQSIGISLTLLKAKISRTKPTLVNQFPSKKATPRWKQQALPSI